jgi:uncharacterized protein (DUF427 family)
MKAIWNGVVIAESDDVVVLEGEHYFPEAALKREFTSFSNHRSSDWKGQAQYLSLLARGELLPDAVCCYPQPQPGAEQILGRVVFGRGVRIED